ncbi:hypothetical protein SAMN04487968_102104 [Nocardioides terrae]|uniref:Uncharacterized protein n=1 Tax=Nocardioides terrae TaxID=574651 RepID=A0A1I1EKN8_9ACTN|nr:hypothetical protein [Nocardioides terrae]SFB87206.1 hypothetical protein SAMN04487968_102104 [Nocardioides terrae]
MRNTSSDVPKQHTTRRAVLKVGANAAWAIPAIQIAAATPAFATSTTSSLTITVTGHSKNGANGTINFTVTAADFAASGVTVTATGSILAASSYTATVGSVGKGASVVGSLNVKFATGNATGPVTLQAKGTSVASPVSVAAPGNAVVTF